MPRTTTTNKTKTVKTTTAGKSRKPSRPKGGPKAMDVHVGNRLRMRRSIIGWSQEKLADCVGLTFQQVQKYERGANRISASRLYDFSRVLDVPISYFFEQYNEKQKPATFKYGFADSDQDEFLDTGKWYDKETLELIRIYYSIQDQKLRRNLVKVIQNMAEMQGLEKKER
ncbi:MAG: helix-turn-helix transcriptional regulator [Micavibrio aeruginosavorus]|uniref:Helix-turn-helix transcriptional regulator n=1 Tax=Micavibrio aeruginosavorus TaxID=349221 RepID=A0A7T5R0Y3_9BACT|nr:MAG: helix-turn-helix transcriptional regulator [Micavibrio aeruginosavorus]